MRSFSKLYRPVLLLIFFHSVFFSYRLLPTIESFTPLWFILPAGEVFLMALLLFPGRLQKIRFWVCLMFSGTLLLYNMGEIFYRFFYMENFHFLKDIPLIPGMFVMLIPDGILSPYFIRVLSVIFTVGLIAILTWIILIPAKVFLKTNSTSIRFPMLFSTMIIALGLMLVFPDYSPGIQIIKGVSASENGRVGIEDIPEVYDKPITPETGGAWVADEPVESGISWKFPGIKDMDVHIVVVESYGATLFQRPEYIETIENLYNRLEPLLQMDGWTAQTGFVLSPAFGGRSWLADATLLTGIHMVNQQIFDEKIAEGSPAELLKLMGDAGYYRHYVAPGTTNTSEEWKIAYPFENYMIRPDFGYEGPNISFGTLTDQFALSVFSENHLQDKRNDFAFYVLVSSHTPFVRIPIFKPDWYFSLNGREYEDGYLKFFENNWLYGNELAEGYLAGISYSLETTVSYLTEILSDQEFMVIIGDHQPRKPVSGSNPGYPVPFHIIVPAENPLTFPESWVLSHGLQPPVLPSNHDGIPKMAEIPRLIRSLLSPDTHAESM